MFSIVSADGQLIANRGLTGGEALKLTRCRPTSLRRWWPSRTAASISISASIRSAWCGRWSPTLSSRRVSQGGSTLTQQLAKNLFLKPDRTLERKVQEVLLALWLEHKYSKDQILEMYLNRVYFGSGAFGVEAASRRYFGKSRARRQPG